MSPVPSKPISLASLIEKAVDFVCKAWEELAPAEFLFHSVETTESWVGLSQKIAEKCELSEEDQALIALAIWFRSYGFLLQEEDLGQHQAQTFLKDQLPEKQINLVKRLIQSTQEGETPQGQLEEVINDSIWAFLGTKKFFDKMALFRIEQEYLQNKTFTDLEWIKYLENLLIQHQFYTPYADGKYEKRRRKNIAKLRSKVKKAKTASIKKKTGKNIGRGIDTLYRVNFRNHINLSSIADGKANTMISINTILLSIIITLSSAGYALIDGLSEQSLSTTIPVIMLLLTCVVSLVFAVLSTRPKVTSKKVNQNPAPSSKQTNLLFFGNFLKVSQDRFVEYLAHLKTNQEQLYEDMSMDLYNLGKVIKEKYDLLTISYNCFLVGIVLTVLSFILLQIF